MSWTAATNELIKGQDERIYIPIIQLNCSWTVNEIWKKHFSVNSNKKLIQTAHANSNRFHVHFPVNLKWIFQYLADYKDKWIILQIVDILIPAIKPKQSPSDADYQLSKEDDCIHLFYVAKGINEMSNDELA